MHCLDFYFILFHLILFILFVTHFNVSQLQRSHITLTIDITQLRPLIAVVLYYLVTPLTYDDTYL